MKIALIGNGKTGHHVEKICKDEITIFNSKNPPDIESLLQHDVILSFLPGDAFKGYIPLFLKAKIPLLTGSTGFAWPDDINQSLQEKKLTWVHAANFSLGMILIKQMIEILSKSSQLFSKYSFSIEETHHTEKLDAPSGTAIKWSKWLGDEAKISSKREGDVVGIHALTLTTKSEEIALKHSALDRSLFAEGALWGAKELLKNRLAPGLHNFEDLVQNILKEGNL